MGAVTCRCLACIASPDPIPASSSSRALGKGKWSTAGMLRASSDLKSFSEGAISGSRMSTPNVTSANAVLMGIPWLIWSESVVDEWRRTVLCNVLNPDHQQRHRRGLGVKRSPRKLSDAEVVPRLGNVVGEHTDRQHERQRPGHVRK